MNKKVLVSILFALFFIYLFSIIPLYAATLHVDKYDSNAEYQSIQAAINAANSGDEIKVSEGTYYENIAINDKNIELLGAGPTTIITPPPKKKIGYIVKDNLTTANSYQTFLTDNNFDVVQINLTNVANTSLSQFDLIIVGPDTGSSYEWGDSASVAAMNAYAGPILGLGGGGSCLFSQLDLFISWGHGWIGTAGSVYANDPYHEVWTTPHQIVSPTSPLVTLYSPSCSYIAIYMPTQQTGVVPIGRQSDDTNHYQLIEEDSKFFLWGFYGSPATMTDSGKNTFLNVIAHLLPHQYYRAKELVLEAWWTKPYYYFLNPLLYYLVPHGTVIYGDGTGNVVSMTNMTSGKIEGFTITNSGPSHSGIYIYSCSNIEISNNRVTKNVRNGILISSSPSVILNKNTIIDNGVTNNAYSDYGVCCLHSTIVFLNNLVIKNPEVGMYIGWEDSSNTSIINNTISGNGYDGIWCYRSSPTIKNNIITNNSYGICAIYDAAPKISYNDVWHNSQNYNQQTGGQSAAGIGDISSDPLFVNPNAEDYHLSTGSPCIDAGDPSHIYNDPDGSRNDMGAYGGYGAGFVTGSNEGGGFVFTTIGYLPVSEIEKDKNSPSFGLANVDPSSGLPIPHYVDSPFGGALRIHGLFGENDNVDYYQILVAKWQGSTEPDPNDLNDPNVFVPLIDPLTKVKYNIQSDGTVVPEYKSLGPQTVYGRENLYELNKEGYWSYPDLRMVWTTGYYNYSNGQMVYRVPNGKYTLRYRAFRQLTIPLYLGGSIQILVDITSSLPHNTQDHLTLVINNTPVEAQIHWVKYDPANPNYNPLVDGNVPECGVIHLQNDHENLRFVITARHADGYLDMFTLDALYGKNRYGGVIKYEQYVGTHSLTPPFWTGVVMTEYQTDDVNTAISGNWNHWENCSYQFRLRVGSRITDGNGWIGHYSPYAVEFNDHYFIELGGGSQSVVPGDMNNDGRVSIDELNSVINAFLTIL